MQVWLTSECKIQVQSRKCMLKLSPRQFSFAFCLRHNASQRPKPQKKNTLGTKKKATPPPKKIHCLRPNQLFWVQFCSQSCSHCATIVQLSCNYRAIVVQPSCNCRTTIVQLSRNYRATILQPCPRMLCKFLLGIANGGVPGRGLSNS